ncbi:MAG TPA: hypothetical protein VIJ38_04480 [Acidobacteriaceae bacterium]
MLSLIPFRDWVYLGIIAVLVIGGITFTVHERHIGEQKIEAADARAKSALDAEVKTQTATLQAAADKAAGDRDATQKSFDAYVAAHPVGAVFVCHNPNNGGSRLPAASRPGSSGARAGAGPAAVSEVPAGSPAVDISSALSTIVRAAGRLAGFDRELQEVIPHADGK